MAEISACEKVAGDACSLRLMQFNIRTGWADWGTETAWNNHVTSLTRRKAVAACILEHCPDVVATQEGLWWQLRDMSRDLRGQYLYVGKPRGGPIPTTNETSAIFLHRQRWAVAETGDFMLSDTPDVMGSKYLGADIQMVTSWVVLTGRSARRNHRILVVSTHLDPYVQQVRSLSAQQLARTSEQLRTAHHCSQAYIIGDFNSDYTEAPYACLRDAGWTDTFYRVHGDDAYPPGSFTYHAWKGPDYVPEGIDKSDPDHPVDFIWSWPPEVEVQKVAVDKRKYGLAGPCPLRGIFPTDHYILVADVVLPPTQTLNRTESSLCDSATDAVPSYKWVPIKKGDKMPMGTVLAGTTKQDGPVYVARDQGGECGKLNVDKGLAHNFWYHHCKRQSCGEVLVLIGDRQVEWVRVRRGDPLPDGAVYSGWTSTDHQVFVARHVGGEAGKVNLKRGRVHEVWCHQSGCSTEGDVLVILDGLEEPTVDGSQSPPTSSLRDAVEDGHEEAVSTLLQFRADVTQVDEHGVSVLQQAVVNRSLSLGIIDMLLNARADPRQKSHDGKELLTMAGSAVKELLKRRT
mmetsp:Transcript_10702/g.29753  ORF Transcript_10702/g.29753 Transcript_10702/m.29753 type:complete len:572 (-) Transcript_10702:336-2051(-)|eukprot:CAMPEP_0194537246 /NCGR_PEP_ID=MMETSP0253-20130528/76456_1 /TAXON_ID=2966 /ORGANISM="Noctiluca scintillans" /LENGTH=571 /DNA_ID=CAMNT_0039383243 /DNA_START=26 /DNA_END=1741 /DNA_ORIENTATION=+